MKPCLMAAALCKSHVLQGQLVAAGAAHWGVWLCCARSACQLDFTVHEERGPVIYKAIPDISFMPDAAMGDCSDVLHVGVKLKYTQAQQTAKQQIQGAALRSLLLSDLLFVAALMFYATVLCRATGRHKKRRADDFDMDLPGKR